MDSTQLWVKSLQLDIAERMNTMRKKSMYAVKLCNTVSFAKKRFLLQFVIFSTVPDWVQFSETSGLETGLSNQRKSSEAKKIITVDISTHYVPPKE